MKESVGCKKYKEKNFKKTAEGFSAWSPFSRRALRPSWNACVHRAIVSSVMEMSSEYTWKFTSKYTRLYINK
jgi:hypothetical protein